MGVRVRGGGEGWCSLTDRCKRVASKLSRYNYRTKKVFTKLGHMFPVLLY